MLSHPKPLGKGSGDYTMMPQSQERQYRAKNHAHTNTGITKRLLHHLHHLGNLTGALQVFLSAVHIQVTSSIAFPRRFVAHLRQGKSFPRVLPAQIHQGATSQPLPASPSLTTHINSSFMFLRIGHEFLCLSSVTRHPTHVCCGVVKRRDERQLFGEEGTGDRSFKLGNRSKTTRKSYRCCEIRYASNE